MVGLVFTTWVLINNHDAVVCLKQLECDLCLSLATADHHGVAGPVPYFRQRQLLCQTDCDSSDGGVEDGCRGQETRSFERGVGCCVRNTVAWQVVVKEKQPEPEVKKIEKRSRLSGFT
jgi:hypothetical protein